MPLQIESYDRAVVVTKTFLPSLMTNGGLVVNVTSGPLPDQPPYMRLPGQGYPGAAYPTSKAGLNRMTEVLANELREYGIAVIAFHPGRARVERSVARLTAAGRASQWIGVEHAIAKREELVTQGTRCHHRNVSTPRSEVPTLMMIGAAVALAAVAIGVIHGGRPQG